MMTTKLPKTKTIMTTVGDGEDSDENDHDNDHD